MRLAASGFELKTRRTRKREFLDEMERVVPWAEPVGLVEPNTPADKREEATGMHWHAGHAVCLEQFVEGHKANSSRSAGMNTPAMRADAGQQPERVANRGQSARETGANALQLSSREFLTPNSRCGRACTDPPQRSGCVPSNGFERPSSRNPGLSLQVRKRLFPEGWRDGDDPGR